MYVSMMQGTQSQYSVITSRDGVGREVGVFRIQGTHVHLWSIHIDVWQKQPQYLQLKQASLRNTYVQISKNSVTIYIVRTNIVAAIPFP